MQRTSSSIFMDTNRAEKWERQIEEQRKLVGQLRRESQLDRKPLSQTLPELIQV